MPGACAKRKSESKATGGRWFPKNKEVLLATTLNDRHRGSYIFPCLVMFLINVKFANLTQGDK